jgi:peptidoglycan hydrolase FlgJ
MSTIQSATTPVSGATPNAEVERLKNVARQLEGVFVEQLFKAMRETVPNDGLTNGGAGEEMFTGLLDQRLSESAPGQWQHGLGEALFRQLSVHLSPGPAAPAPETSNSKGVSRTS